VIHTSHHRSLRTLFVPLCLVIALITPTHTSAWSYSDIPKVIVIGTAGYGASQVFAAWTCSNATKTYANVRAVLAAHHDDRPTCRDYVKQEILRAHNGMTRSYWVSEPPHKHAPFVWYKQQLESTLRYLTLASWLNTDPERGQAIAQLLHDLQALHDYVITDYHLITEQRRTSVNHHQ
jgi:hypothetical protein